MKKDKAQKAYDSFKTFLKNEPIVPILTRNLSFLLDSDKRIQNIEINSELKSYTDGKKVVVSGLACFMFPEYGAADWTVMLRVNLAHEIQHDNSSDFELIKKVQAFYGNYLKKNFNINEAIGQQFGQRVLNMMEDGRINEIVVQRFPGYLSMMRFVNFGIRDEIERSNEDKNENISAMSQEFIDFDSQILSYCKTGYNAPGIQKYAGKQLEIEFLKIKSLLDAGVGSSSAKGCYDSCIAVLETCAEYVASLCREESAIMDFLQSLAYDNYSQDSNSRSEQKGNSDGPTITIRKQEKTCGDSPRDDENKPGHGEGEGEDSKDAGENDDDKEGKDGKTSKDGNGKDDKAGKENKAGENGKNGGNSKDKKNKHPGGDKNSAESAKKRAQEDGPQSIDDVIGAGFSGTESPTLTEDELKEMLTAAEEDLRKSRAAEKANEVLKGSPMKLSPQERKQIKDLYANVTFTENFITPLKKTISPAIKIQADQLRRKLMRILVVTRAASSGHRKGTLNPGALWKVGIENGDIFQRKNPPQISNCAVYELIDGSGSMSSQAYNSVSKIFTAISTAAIMEEALKGIAATKVTVFCGGYQDVQHTVIKDFNQNPVGNRCFDALSSIGANNGNKDGYSIRIASMDLAKRPEKHKILLVLSDGLPSAYKGTDAAKTDVRNAVKWAKNHGIIVIPIMFGEDNFRKANLPSYREMYESNIIACNPGGITNEIEKILTKVVR